MENETSSEQPVEWWESAEYSQKLNEHIKTLKQNLVYVGTSGGEWIGLPNGKIEVGKAGKLQNAFISMWTPQGVRICNNGWCPDAPVAEIDIHPSWVIALRTQSEGMKETIAMNYTKLEHQFKIREPVSIEKMPNGDYQVVRKTRAGQGLIAQPTGMDQQLLMNPDALNKLISH